MRSQAKIIEVISPHTEQAIAEVAAAGPAGVDDAVRAARAAFDAGPWGKSESSERIAAATSAMACSVCGEMTSMIFACDRTVRPPRPLGT